MKPQQKYHLGTASDTYPGWGRRVKLVAWCKTLLKKLQWAASYGHTENVKNVNHIYIVTFSDEGTNTISECEDYAKINTLFSSKLRTSWILVFTELKIEYTPS